MQANIKAFWQGSFKQGNGHLSIENSKLNSITFKPSYVKSDGGFTNPEELLGSALASCYTMTLGYILGENALSADTIQTSVSVVVSNNVITNCHMKVQAKIPGVTQEQFQDFSVQAKEMCPVGNTIKAEISVDAILIS